MDKYFSFCAPNQGGINFQLQPFLGRISGGGATRDSALIVFKDFFPKIFLSKILSQVFGKYLLLYQRFFSNIFFEIFPKILTFKNYSLGFWEIFIATRDFSLTFLILVKGRVIPYFNQTLVMNKPIQLGTFMVFQYLDVAIQEIRMYSSYTTF